MADTTPLLMCQNLDHQTGVSSDFALNVENISFMD